MSRQSLHPRTELLNARQKNLSKIARYEALHWLMQRFPKAFDNRESIQPLKQGIMQDILAFADEAAAQGISKSKLREAVVLYTRRVDYLTALKAQESRIDLEGNLLESVDEEQAERAAQKIRRNVEKTIKNNKKSSATRSVEPSRKPFNSTEPALALEPAFEAYPLRTEPQPQKAVPTILHKTSKNLDPNAVARLKAKLGLAAKSEELS